MTIFKGKIGEKEAVQMTKLLFCRYLPANAEDFEEVAIEICELIKAGDPRIGVLPKPKKKK